MRSLGVIVLASIALAFGAPVHAQSFVPADEAQNRHLLNLTRAGKGLATLPPNDQLIAMARGQATRMANRGSIYHNPDLGGEITRRGLNWSRVGENVGMGPSAVIIEDALLKSPHHYENIIHSDYNAVGVGIVEKAGKIYLVQVFAALKSQVSAPKAPAPSAPRPVQAAPKTAVKVAALAHAAPTARPVPVAAPKPAASVYPNAVVGGVVTPTAWPAKHSV